MTNLKPHALSLAMITFCTSGYVSAISLDEAVNNQIGRVNPGDLPCQALIDAGADLTGSLLDICSRAIPAGTTSQSTGGGSAAPALIPAGRQDLSREDELVDAQQGPWSVFFTAESENLDRNTTINESGFDSSIQRIVGGVSYRASDVFTTSVAINLTDDSGDYDSGGEFDRDSTGIRALASFYPSEANYVDVVLRYDNVNTTRTRLTDYADLANGAPIFSVVATPEADYSYDQLGFTLQSGFDWSMGAFNLSPFIGIEALTSDFGTYSETGQSGLELTFHNDERESLQGFVGVHGSYTMTTGFGAFVPQFTLRYRNEFETDARNVSVSFVEDLNSTRFSFQTDELDSSFMDASLGGLFLLKGGTQIFANLQTLVGHEQFDSLIANAGLRFKF